MLLFSVLSYALLGAQVSEPEVIRLSIHVDSERNCIVDEQRLRNELAEMATRQVVINDNRTLSRGDEFVHVRVEGAGRYQFEGNRAILTTCRWYVYGDIERYHSYDSQNRSINTSLGGHYRITMYEQRNAPYGHIAWQTLAMAGVPRAYSPW